VQVPDLAESSYDDLEVIIYGASPIAEDTLRRAMEIFRCDFYQGFGQTESSGSVTFLTADEHRRALAGRPELLQSAGRALLATRLRIVDAGGREVPRGVTGEIVARGPQLMRGYWNLPEATAETLVDGWLHTGDAGTMDEDGYVYVKDRLKDMVVSGGENIYPREVEDVLFEHPAIADAAVIGVPDEKYGEAVMAVLVLRRGKTLEADELIAYCRTKLAGYKIPRRIEFAEELPRNPGGKVLKKDLRAPYWKGTSRSVG
jgi:acyl-CoA synthetase (AMP-forming)/AMP-acid ligase II